MFPKVPLKKVFLSLKILYFVIMTWLFLILSREALKESEDIFEMGNSRYVKIDPLYTTQEFEKDIWRDVLKIIWDYGAGGLPVEMDAMTRKYGEDSMLIHGYNILLSVKIPVKRIIRDLRHPSCREVVYDKELPTASVIIAFHNVPLSILLRTIWTVINVADNPKQEYPDHNSSCHLPLKELILVDDCSSNLDLKGKLAHYVKTRLPPDLVQILRLSKSLGPLRARIIGARQARAQVLVFLDPHSEGQPDWLRPLLQRVKQTRTAVVVPQMDRIDGVDFGYVAEKELMVGGFTFSGVFHWIPVTRRDVRRNSEIAPVSTPMMKGGTFAINRKYFWELGGIEHKTTFWGTEDLELSFRIWQCGGTIEVIPCSRIGVFSHKMSHSATWEVNRHMNAAQTAEVWMDQYKELFYFHWMQYKNHTLVRDLWKRRRLRENLSCRSFQWFLDTVYKPKFIPVRDTVALGRILNPRLRICLDKRKGQIFSYKCHKSPGEDQYFTLSTDGQIRDERACVRLRRRVNETQDVDEYNLEYVPCNEHDKEKWVYLSTRQLLHVPTGLCLSSSLVGMEPAILASCRPGAPQQKWTFDYIQNDGYSFAGEIMTKQQEANLRHIRNQRRTEPWDAKDVVDYFHRNMTELYLSIGVSNYMTQSHRNNFKITWGFS